MPDNDKDSVHKKETSGHKRKASDSSKSKGTPEHIEVNVVENGAIIGASPSHGEGPSTALLTAMQEGFVQMSGNMANAITEAFKSFRTDLEISYDNDIREEDLLNSDHEGESPTKKKREDANGTSKNSIDVDASVGQLLNRSNTTSNEGKSSVLSSLKQDLQKEETGPKVDSELANIINTLINDGLPEEKLQDKMKYHLPENCESLTKVHVNQAVWDNLSPSVRSQDIRMQKVQTSLFKGMCALTGMINKPVEQIPTFPVGNNLLQEATDAFALFANANTELNHRRRELIKPDLHNDYKHLCSSSLASKDQLFGDDLPKQVKDLTEVNHVGKKVTTNVGLSSKSFDARNSRNYRFSSSRGRGYRQA